MRKQTIELFAPHTFAKQLLKIAARASSHGHLSCAGLMLRLHERYCVGLGARVILSVR